MYNKMLQRLKSLHYHVMKLDQSDSPCVSGVDRHCNFYFFSMQPKQFPNRLQKKKNNFHCNNDLLISQIK